MSIKKQFYPVQLVNLPADRIASTWRKYLDCFANCLLHWGGDPQSPSGLRMERLYWEAGLLWGSVQIKHPDRLAVSLSETLMHLILHSHLRQSHVVWPESLGRSAC